MTIVKIDDQGAWPFAQKCITLTIPQGSRGSRRSKPTLKYLKYAKIHPKMCPLLSIDFLVLLTNIETPEIDKIYNSWQSSLPAASLVKHSEVSCWSKNVERHGSKPSILFIFGGWGSLLVAKWKTFLQTREVFGQTLPQCKTFLWAEEGEQ